MNDKAGPDLTLVVTHDLGGLRSRVSQADMAVSSLQQSCSGTTAQESVSTDTPTHPGRCSHWGLELERWEVEPFGFLSSSPSRTGPFSVSFACSPRAPPMHGTARRADGDPWGWEEEDLGPFPAPHHPLQRIKKTSNFK